MADTTVASRTVDGARINDSFQPQNSEDYGPPLVDSKTPPNQKEGSVYQDFRPRPLGPTYRLFPHHPKPRQALGTRVAIGVTDDHISNGAEKSWPAERIGDSLSH